MIWVRCTKCGDLERIEDYHFQLGCLVCSDAYIFCRNAGWTNDQKAFYK